MRAEILAYYRRGGETSRLTDGAGRLEFIRNWDVLGRVLPADAASADAVLLFGPLYHLLDRAERIRAWREAARVVRPGGVVVAATITRFASLLDGFVQGYLAEPEFGPVVNRVLATGEHRPPDGRWFTTAYFHHPDELPGEVAEADLELDRIVSVEGPAAVGAGPGRRSGMGAGGA